MYEEATIQHNGRTMTITEAIESREDIEITLDDVLTQDDIERMINFDLTDDSWSSEHKKTRSCKKAKK